MIQSLRLSFRIRIEKRYGNGRILWQKVKKKMKKKGKSIEKEPLNRRIKRRKQAQRKENRHQEINVKDSKDTQKHQPIQPRETRQ